MSTNQSLNIIYRIITYKDLFSYIIKNGTKDTNSF